MAEARKYLRARPQRDYKYSTTLAIDWGSEGVRAKLFYIMEDGQMVDKLLQHTSTIGDITIDRHEVRRQFTSQIYPFDSTTPNPPGATIYPGNNRLFGRRSISSKLAMYAVVGISDEVARQSPALRDLQMMVQLNPQLKQIIRIGIEQLIFCVLRRVYSFLNFHTEAFRRDLDAVALTIPAQWTIEFEEVYGEMFTAAWERVFNCEVPQLIFMTEGQTNAHYAFFRGTFAAESDRQHLSAQGFFNIGKTKNAVLLIDAGGHSTNTSLVTICEDNNQLEIRPDQGAIGGTAMWALHVLVLAKTKWLEDFPDRRMPAEVENQILKLFYLFLPEYRDHTGASFNLRNFGYNRVTFGCVLSPEELVQAYEDATTHAFALIEEGIFQLKDLQPNCDTIEVVIGGGSAQAPMWIQRMANLCRKHQINQPTYLFQIDQLYEYARVAGGANYALAEAKSVTQFVEQAAFGLAVKKRSRGENGWTDDWHNQATLLWAQGKKWINTIKTDGSEKFKIVCQPEYNNPRAKSTIELNYKAYDILPIPCQKKGTLQFNFEIDTDTDKLKLMIKHRDVLKSGKTRRSTEIGQVEFDLWVAPGSRCLQIWDCVEDIEVKVAAAFSGSQQPAGNNASGGEVAEAMEVDSGPVRQPNAVPGRQAHRGPPELGSQDVVMSGMEDAEEIADSITVAPVDDEGSVPPRGQGGSQAAQRRRRRGSTVPTGIFAQ